MAQTLYIETWNDNGTTIDFTGKQSNSEQIWTFQLTRTPDGHLEGSVLATRTYLGTEYNELGLPEENWGTGMEGTLNLVPAR